LDPYKPYEQYLVILYELRRKLLSSRSLDSFLRILYYKSVLDIMC